MRPADLLVPIVLSLYLSGCVTDATKEISFSGTWRELGLSPEHVNIIKTSGQAVYAATDSDLFRGTLSAESEWDPLGLKDHMEDGEWVRDFMVYNESEILGGLGHATERDSDYFEHFIPFFYTADGGETWEPIENEFTENKAIFNRLAATPELDTLYALNGGNVVRSTDRGQSWTPVYWLARSDDKWEPHTNSWFIVIDQQHTNNIWTGGMTIALTPYLNKSSDRGSTWEHIHPYEGTIEAVARDLVIDWNNSDHVLLAMGVVILSQDKGENWEGSYQGASIRALENSLAHDQVVYASGIHPSGKVFMAASPDFGDMWETIIYEEGPSGVTVNDLAVAKTGGREVLYFGTNKGVYSYTFGEQ